MKIVKKLILAILFILVAIFTFNINGSYARTVEYGNILQISENIMTSSDDIYCVAYEKIVNALPKFKELAKEYF